MAKQPRIVQPIVYKGQYLSQDGKLTDNKKLIQAHKEVYGDVSTTSL